MKHAEQLRVPGFERALLSMFRHGALGEQRCYESLSALHLPVIVLRGSDDLIVTPSQMAVLRACLPRPRHQEIPGTAHGFFLSHPEPVADIIIGYLRDSANRVTPATGP